MKSAPSSPRCPVMTSVQLIFFEGCPNVGPIQALLKSVPGLSFEEVRQDRLPPGHRLRKYSSPSVLLDDRLVFGVETDSEEGSCSVASAGDLSALRRVLNRVSRLGVLAIAFLLSSTHLFAEVPMPTSARMVIPKDAATLSQGDRMHEVSLRAFQEAFNEASGKVRVVSLLSPTCSYCQAGHQSLGQIFSGLKSDRLTGLLVWLPMMSRDDAHMALAQSLSFRDDRIALQGWDGKKEIAERFSKTLALKVSAWDVYLVYAPGVKWSEDLPPAPTFWMHQLRIDEGGNPKQCLNVGELRREIERIVRRTTP